MMLLHMQRSVKRKVWRPMEDNMDQNQARQIIKLTIKCCVDYFEKADSDKVFCCGVYDTFSIYFTTMKECLNFLKREHFEKIKFVYYVHEKELKYVAEVSTVVLDRNISLNSLIEEYCE